MVEKKKGRPAEPTADEQRSGVLWARLVQDANDFGLDPRITSQIGRLRIARQLTDSQAGAADRIGQVYGKYERDHGVRRSARSPSYQIGRGGAGRARTEAEISETNADYHKIQACIPLVPREARDVIEQLCVENRVISSWHLPDVRVILDRVHAKFEDDAPDTSPLAPTRRSKPRASRQERLEEGLYATLNVGRLSGAHAPAPMTEAEAAEVSARNLAQDAALT